MAGLGKKGPKMTSREFARMFDQVSKAALIDALWCACQLGTTQENDQITTQAARNVEIALRERDDRVPKDIAAAALLRIDSDPETFEPCGDCGATGTHHCPAWCDVPGCDTTAAVSSCNQRTR